MNAMTDSPKAQQVIERVIYLHCAFNLKTNLGWYMQEGCISQEAAQEMGTVFDQAVKTFLPHMNTAMEALGVFKQPHLIAPIGRDYIAFNNQNDYENFESAGQVFDFRRTGEPLAKL